jgi:hypothetical protein
MENAVLLQAEEAIERKEILKARGLLEDLVFNEPRNDQAWLLLSTVVEHRNEQIDCLRKALSINPNNSEAREMMDELAPPPGPLPEMPKPEQLPPEIVLPASLNSSDLHTGGVLQPDKQRLLELVRQDPANEAAWLKLADQAATDQEEADCLRRAIAANPYNTVARLRLSRLGTPSSS